MEEPGGHDQTLRFGLAVLRTVTNGKEEFFFQSFNEGIPDADVALSVQAWVEKLTEKIKEQRITGTTFGR